MLLKLFFALPDVFISKVLPQISYQDLESLQKIHKVFHELITSSIFWHRRLYHQLKISTLPNALCTVERSKLLEKLCNQGLKFPIKHAPPEKIISNFNNIEIYYENSDENIGETSGSQILRFHNTNTLHVQTVMEEKIYPELVADVFVEIEFSMDLESKLDRDQPWIFELNDQQFIVENPLRYFISSLQTHSYCNYRPFSANETKEVKWFKFIPDLLCKSKIRNSFSMICLNPNGLSGIQLKDITLKAKRRIDTFVCGLFVENKRLDNNQIFRSLIDPIGLLREHRAVEVIQKLSPGYYLEYPEPFENSQILKLQQTAYINLKIEIPINQRGKFKISLRMKILERFHFGKCLAITNEMDIAEENQSNTISEISSRIIENPNSYFGKQFPVEEWFEWKLCEFTSDTNDGVFICKIRCQNDRSWKSGLEFSSINVYAVQ